MSSQFNFLEAMVFLLVILELKEGDHGIATLSQSIQTIGMFLLASRITTTYTLKVILIHTD